MAVCGGGGGGILVGGRGAIGGNIPGLSRAGAALVGDTDVGMPPVSTRFMSSPEHWNTSMYLCFLPNIMLRWCFC